MSNTGFSGIDERQNGTPLLIDASLKDSSGALITGGSTLLALVEVQSDGTFLSYDFFDNTFKAGALTTPTVAMTHQKANNGTTNTGLWNYVLATISGFTVGANYRQIVTNSGASPTQQERAWQFAGGPNDKASTLLTRIPSTITISGGKVAATIASGDDVDTAILLGAIGTPMQAGAHVQLATTQDQYAPAKAGDKMDLINILNVATDFTPPMKASLNAATPTVFATIDPVILGAAIAAGLATVGLSGSLLAALRIMVGGPGPILVDHNYGGANNLQFTDLNGAGIEAAIIQAFRSSDYNGGRRTSTYVVGQTMTDINGDWLLPLALPAGSYILVVTKAGTVGSSGSYGPYVTPLAVA